MLQSKTSLQILVAVHCGSFTITLIMILPSTTLLFYFFLRSSIRETKAFRIILEEGRKKKSAAVNYSLLCIDMNSCHLNQYFNSKPNHSPLDKILQCHFLLLDLSSGWQWIMVLCLLAVLLVMSLESTVNKGFQFDG